MHTTIGALGVNFLWLGVVLGMNGIGFLGGLLFSAGVAFLIAGWASE